jgi:hypothetical protein
MQFDLGCPDISKHYSAIKYVVNCRQFRVRAKPVLEIIPHSLAGIPGIADGQGRQAVAIRTARARGRSGHTTQARKTPWRASGALHGLEFRGMESRPGHGTAGRANLTQGASPLRLVS